MINFFDREYMIRRELCHEAKVACSLSTFNLIFQFMEVLSEELRSLRSMTTSFQTTSFHPLVTSFHQIVTSFQTIVTSFQVYTKRVNF